MMISDYQRQVKSLKKDYSEEISPFLSSPKRGLKSKARKSWFQSVSQVLGEGIRKGYLPSKYLQTFHKFHNRNRETGFNGRLETTLLYTHLVAPALMRVKSPHDTFPA